jgi:hypothetical protein
MRTIHIVIAILWAWPAAAQQSERPLPELKSFLNEFQVKRMGLFKALMDVHVDSTGQYTYMEKCTEITLDSAGKPKNSKPDVYEIIPTGAPSQVYRRQTIKTGVPLSQKELDKHDRGFKESLARQEAAEQRRRAAAAAKPKQEPAKKPERGPENMFLSLFEFRIAGREVIDDRPLILLTFKPKPNYKPHDSLEKMLQHVTGRAWVSEDDYELARVEADLVDRITFGAGILARIQPGSKGAMEWRRINNEVWLPYKREFIADARILLLKGMHQHVTSEFSDYRKYSVDTELKFGTK